MNNVCLKDSPRKVNLFIFKLVLYLFCIWKCEKASCKGRGHSDSLEPPFLISQLHNHLPAPVRSEILKKEESMKEEALTTTNSTRSIIREANKDLTEEAAAKYRSINIDAHKLK